MDMGLYVRLSALKQRADATEATMGRQETAGRQTAKARGDRIVGVYKDPGKSAYRDGVVRDQFERLLEDLETGHIQGVIVWKIDRLMRTHRDWVRLAELCKRLGRVIVSCTEPIDTSTPHGRFIVDMLVSQAQMESANIGLRVQAQREQAARAGRPGHGGGRPYGYDKSRVHTVPAEAEALRQAGLRLLAGESLRSTARGLNDAGMFTTAGKPWTGQILRRVLSNPRYAGLRAYKGDLLGDATWPAIFDRGEWEQIQALLAEPGRRSQVGRPRIFLLVGGLVRCGDAGDVLVDDEKLCYTPLLSGRRGDPSRSDDGRRYYCPPTTAPRPGCGGVSVAAGPLEDLVAEAVLERHSGGRFAKAYAASLADENLTAFARQIDEDDLALGELERDYRVRRVIRRREYLAIKEELEARIARNRARLARRAEASALASWPTAEAALRAEWAKAGVDRRRTLLDAYLEAVIVRPGGGVYVKGKRGRQFDGRRVDLRWRF